MSATPTPASTVAAGRFEGRVAFEAQVLGSEQVQQCWRVSPGPDFVLVVYARDMPGYLALAQKLFTAQANVRNVKAYFATKRSKFVTRIPLQKGPHLPRQ